MEGVGLSRLTLALEFELKSDRDEETHRRGDGDSRAACRANFVLGTVPEPFVPEPQAWPRCHLTAEPSADSTLCSLLLGSVKG